MGAVQSKGKAAVGVDSCLALSGSVVVELFLPAPS